MADIPIITVRHPLVEVVVFSHIDGSAEVVTCIDGNEVGKHFVAVPPSGYRVAVLRDSDGLAVVYRSLGK